MVSGVLDLAGKKSDLSFPFEFNDNSFSASFEVDRFALGLDLDKGPQAKAAKVLKMEIKMPVSK